MAKERIGENFDLEIGVDASVGNFPPGIHLAKCISAKVEPNKAGDSNNLVLEFEAVEGEYAGRRIRSWLSFKDTVRWKMTEALVAFGIPFTKDKNGKPKAHLTRKAFIDQEVRLQVINEDYMGEERPQVDKILEAREGTAAAPAKPAAPEAAEDDSSAPAEDVAEDTEAEEDLPF